MTADSEKYMRTAIKEALKSTGRVSPNPVVGAVIVKDGRIIGKGHHKVYGGPHAEVNAVNSCDTDPEGSDMYVTLEPCSHHGKTPPCTDLIIKNKIKRVYIGIIDPSNHASGKGIDIMREAGIEVITGILEKQCRSINLPFFHFLETGYPLVILKSAVSLDGSTATDSFDSKWISCEKSREHVHRLRSIYDAVIVGRNTVEKDDPLLTVRNRRGRNPVRIILDEDLSLNPRKNVFSGTSETIIITSVRVSEISETKYTTKGIRIIKVDETNGELDLRQALAELGKYGIRSVMAESGALLSNYLLKNRIADRIILFLAPKLIGSSKKLFTGSGIGKISEGIMLEDISIKRYCDDIMIEGELRYSI